MRLGYHSCSSITNLITRKSDAFDPGVNVTVISGVLGITSLVTLLYLALRPLPRSTTSSSSLKPTTRPILLLTSALHTLLSIWIFAALIAYDVIVRNRSARVSAFLPNGQSLPQSLVEQQERALGVSSVYWDKEYRECCFSFGRFHFVMWFVGLVVLGRLCGDCHCSCVIPDVRLDDTICRQLVLFNRCTCL